MPSTPRRGRLHRALGLNASFAARKSTPARDRHAPLGRLRRRRAALAATHDQPGADFGPDRAASTSACAPSGRAARCRPRSTPSPPSADAGPRPERRHRSGHAAAPRRTRRARARAEGAPRRRAQRRPRRARRRLHARRASIASSMRPRIATRSPSTPVAWQAAPPAGLSPGRRARSGERAGAMIVVEGLAKSFRSAATPRVRTAFRRVAVGARRRRRARGPRGP